MNKDHSRSAANSILEEICLECGSLCCRLGGIVATKSEVDAIVAQGYPDNFVELSHEVYGTEWGRDGTCPYLDSGRCSIYSVRPMGCRMFPVVQTPSKDVILVECPLALYLSKRELAERKNILQQRPDQVVRESEHLRHEHLRDLQIRTSKFKHRRL